MSNQQQNKKILWHNLIILGNKTVISVKYDVSIFIFDNYLTPVVEELT